MKRWSERLVHKPLTFEFFFFALVVHIKVEKKKSLGIIEKWEKFKRRAKRTERTHDDAEKWEGVEKNAHEALE